MIEAIRLQNCQSWEDCTITLASDRLNVLVAANDTGKSVLFKLLKLAGDPGYYPEIKRKDLIRRGSSNARATFKFTDGSYAIMQLEQNKTMYAYVEKLGDPLRVELEPPERMIQELGLLPSAGESFIANIVDTEQGLLLVNSKLKSTFDLIRMIATCEELDTLRERVDALVGEFRNKNERAMDNFYFLERQLEAIQYQDVSALERKVERADAAFEVMETLCASIDHLTRLQEIQVEVKDYDSLICIASVLDGMKLDKIVWREEPIPGGLGHALEILEEIAGKSWVMVGNEPLPIGLGDSLATLDAIVEAVPTERVEKPLPWELCDMCSIVEAVTGLIDRVSVQREPVVSEFGYVLEILEEIAATVNTTFYSRPVDAELVDALEVLEQVTGTSSHTMLPDYSEVAELEIAFRNSGSVVDCPLYGEVVFDGKNCVAGSD